MTYLMSCSSLVTNLVYNFHYKGQSTTSQAFIFIDFNFFGLTSLWDTWKGYIISSSKYRETSTVTMSDFATRIVEDFELGSRILYL